MTTALFQAVIQGRLVGSRCPKCGHRHFPPVSRCVKCGGVTELEDVPKEGVVLTYSEVYVSNSQFETPYVVAVAQFGQYKLPGRVLTRVDIGDRVVWEIVDITRPPGRWYVFKKI